LLLLLLYCGLTKQKGMCARTRIHIRQTGTHCMREKTTKNEGMGYKFFCFFVLRKRWRRNEILLIAGFGRKTLLCVIPQTD
jgi:hypothetical protein